jgi:hypothetical protein
VSQIEAVVMAVLVLGAGVIGFIVVWKVDDSDLIEKSVHCVIGFFIALGIGAYVASAFLPKGRPDGIVYDDPTGGPDDPCDVQRYC